MHDPKMSPSISTRPRASIQSGAFFPIFGILSSVIFWQRFSIVRVDFQNREPLIECAPSAFISGLFLDAITALSSLFMFPEYLDFAILTS
jgi:hypothetical protein